MFLHQYFLSAPAPVRRNYERPTGFASDPCPNEDLRRRRLLRENDLLRGQEATLTYLIPALILGLLFGDVGPKESEKRGAALARFEYARLKMGTSVRLVLYAPDELQARAAADAAFLRMDRLEEILSHYRENSELNLVSRGAGGEPRRVSPELLAVLQSAARLSARTKGALDITIGPMARLWRESRRTGQLPDIRTLEEARAVVGHEKIKINAGTGVVLLERKGMELDLSAVAKGYIADEALALLKARGIARALVDAGGDVVVSDPPPGKAGWRVAIQEPDAEPGAPRIVTLRNCAVATSGDSYQHVEIGGKRYSHVLDPRTGLGANDAASATVIAPTGLLADGLATAFCVMEPGEAIRLADATPGVSTMIVRRSAQGFTRASSAAFPP
jgi:FAD:protein FMN transferase